MVRLSKNKTIILIKYVFQINAAYEVIFEKIEASSLDEDKVLAFDGLRIKKFNRTRFINIYYNIIMLILMLILSLVML